MEKTKIKCENPECLHEWETSSKMMKTTCSCCGLKTKNPNFKKEVSKE